MNNHLSWITGLMRENYEAVGFIPDTTLREQYIDKGRYVLQMDERGHHVGYLLHGTVKPGGILRVAQHCIDADKRLRGFGELAFETLLDRAVQRNCRAIVLRCAEGLESNAFWQALGFEKTNTLAPDNARQRRINVYTLDLWPMIFR